MDIEILLWFQSFREATSEWLSAFFSFITTISVDCFIMVPALILFWCVSKKKGSQILLTWGTSLGIGALLKCIFCVYRPWVRDSRITPPESIISGATGYSFPSGHCFSAGGFWNGLAVAYHKYRGLVIFAAVMVCTTMFSRLYFTVHTPQDVLVGAVLSLLIALGVSKVLAWVDGGQKRDLIVLGAVTAYIVFLLLYTSLKSYPMDYDANGVLLVDPKKLTVDGFKDPGRFYGIVLGWFLERRFIRFSTDGTAHQKVMRSVIGGVLAIFWWHVVAAPIGKLAGVGIVHFLMQATTPLLFMTLYPWLFSKYEAARRRKTSAASVLPEAPSAGERGTRS